MNANSEKNKPTDASLSYPALNWRPKLYVDKKGKHCYPKWDLKDRLVAGLRTDISNCLDAGGIHGDERRNVLAALFKSLTEELEKTDYPSLAPELYKDRAKREIEGVFRKEKPDEFVRRVYQKWLNQVGGLPRPTLKELDEACYRALYKHGFPDDFETLLPPARGRSARHIGLTDIEILESRRKTERARYHRNKK